MSTTTAKTIAFVHPQEHELLRLNNQYLAALLAGDAEWFHSHLADEFVCIESDGSVHMRDQFLRLVAMGSDLREYELDLVEVQFYGDVAIVRATGSWATKAGAKGMSRYIDIYVYAGNSWKVVSAQVTRPPKK